MTRSNLLTLLTSLLLTQVAFADKDPVTGRFLQRDPLATGLPVLNENWFHGRAPQVDLGIFDARWHYSNGMNLYEFVGSNPVNRTDPSGLDWWDDDIDAAMNEYAWGLIGVSNQLAQARADMAKGAKLAALYAAAAFLWDEMIWDRDEAILLGLVTGGFFARACFEEGTPVMLADGTSVAIECVEVGTHVVSLPAEPGGAALADSSLNPDTWRLIRLESNDPARGTVAINLLRPIEWITATRAEAGRTVTLTVPEMGLRGPATVCSIEPCPATASGPLAGMVTGTFATEKAKTVSVYLESLTEPIGATASHPFFSLDRRAWTAAAQLRPSERVQTADGEAKIARLQVRATPESVYNLEVQGTHTYFVSKARVWVHNGCVPDFAKQSARNFRQWAKQFGNPNSTRIIARADVQEVITEARKLRFTNIRVELGGTRSGEWAGKWHINMNVPDGGRTLHLLTEAP